MKIALWVLAGVMAGLAIGAGGCDSADEGLSTQITKTVGKVECGYAFDWAKGDLHEVKRVVAPADAEVRPDAQGDTFVVYMQKTLDYSGEVAGPMSIRTLRQRMGVAARMENDALLLATYGEWNGTPGSGGASIRLVILVPPGVQVDRRAELSGKGSPANGEESVLRSGPPNPAAKLTASGWMPLSQKYDAERRVLK